MTHTPTPDKKDVVVVPHGECPYPIIPDHSAKACIAAGHCGCDEFWKLENHSEQSLHLLGYRIPPQHKGSRE